ncbi:MAG: hypothetical protein EA380_03940 [Phycisphaeraceae bacterium]|nr:MAG: hypothetical protein EA380_03940 [Phycisphaeraceae bacterium]
MKKTPIVLVILIIVVTGGGYFAWRHFNSATSGLDEWVARQVVRFGQAYIVPTIDFESFRYSNRVLTLSDVTFTAPDSTEVIRAGTVTVTLAQLPSIGRPIVIERVELADATLRLLRDTETGGFRGLVPFMRTERIADQEQVDEDVRITRVLQIRKVGLQNCGFEFDPGDGQPPMRMAQISLDLDVTPVEGQTDRIYELALDIDRNPIIHIKGEGLLNLDALTLETKSIELIADLADDEALASLPPQLQTIVNQYEAHGKLDMKVTGLIALLDIFGSTISADLELKDFNIAQGEARLPIESAVVQAQLRDRIGVLRETSVSALRGTVSLVEATADFNSPAMPMTLGWAVSQIELREIVRASTDREENPRYAGILTSSGNMTANLAEIPESISGSGTLELRNGRLVFIPVINELVRAMDLLGQVTGTPRFQDQADIEFNLTGTGIEITRMSITTPAAGARGTGTIGYDTSLNLSVNAGPLERVQSALGGVGDILGAVTDRLVTYRIRGTTSEPRVSVAPLGIGG